MPVVWEEAKSSWHRNARQQLHIVQDQKLCAQAVYEFAFNGSRRHRSVEQPEGGDMSILADLYARGVTFRKRSSGTRAMFHRWPASKIKDAITVRQYYHQIMIKNIIRNNALVDRLLDRCNTK